MGCLWSPFVYLPLICSLDTLLQSLIMVQWSQSGDARLAELDGISRGGNQHRVHRLSPQVRVGLVRSQEWKPEPLGEGYGTNTLGGGWASTACAQTSGASHEQDSHGGSCRAQLWGRQTLVMTQPGPLFPEDAHHPPWGRTGSA